MDRPIRAIRARLKENSMSDDETVQRLRDFRDQLEAEVWPAATEAAAEYHVDQVTHLVQLKARIDALTWAIDHRPRERAKIGF